MKSLLRTTAVLLFAVTAACPGEKPAPASALHGVGMDPPIPRPSFTLTATDGKPFEFRERTAGKLTFLFFGYTNCPDVCPVHAANIAASLQKLSWEDRQRVQFVFVTTDPDRDSLPALRKWLDHFDKSFIGLRGPKDSVTAVLAKFNFPGAILDEKAADGTYGVSHAAAVFAFQPDDIARVFYLFGTRQADWDADIPLLLGPPRK